VPAINRDEPAVAPRFSAGSVSGPVDADGAPIFDEGAVVADESIFDDATPSLSVPTATPTNAPAEPINDLHKAVWADPFVRRLVERFNGRLADIRSANSQ